MKKTELIANYFATIYLTFISLLQSVALSQLVPIIILYIEKAEHPWTDVHLPPIMLMLLIIFIVWHHYAMGIFFLRWFPNIIDTIIPFVISIGQFFLISYLTIKDSVSDMNLDAWTKGFAVFMVVGAAPYFAAAWRNKAALYTNIMSLENGIIHSRYIRKYYNMAGWSIFIQGVFASFIVFTGMQSLLMLSLVLFLAHLVLSELVILHTIRPHFERSMDEFHENQL